MRRADRLFQIIQILRRTTQPVTAATLAQELEVSPRTVYRDMADLIGQRVPIQGEAGLGYVLGEAFDMPPLMLTPDEIEAAVLGAQWVAGRGEPVLAAAARDLIAKITAVVPERLRLFVDDPSIATPPGFGGQADGIDVARGAGLDPGGPQDPPRLSRRAGDCDPADRLAGDCGVLRAGAGTRGLV